MRNIISARVAVPKFWPVSEKAIDSQFADIPPEQLVRYGSSAGGRSLRLVRFPVPDRPRLWVIGGTHGHEPGSVAAVFNLISVLRNGNDLRGRPWPDLASLAAGVDITLVPVLNPDGRARCPDSLVGWPTAGIQGFAQSWDREGNVVPLAEAVPMGIDPHDVLFLGGRFNDDGILANRPLSTETTFFVEFQQLLTYMADRPPEGLVDLHACANNCCICNGGFDEPYRIKLRRLHVAIEAALKAVGHPYCEDLLNDSHTRATGIVGNVRILYSRFGTLAFPWEGRSGYIDILPWCDENQIIDDYLIAITEIVRLGVHEGYIPGDIA